MATATSVMSTLPIHFRCKRQEIGGAQQQLINLDRNSSNMNFKQLAYGVLYADSTGRTTGTVWQAAQLIAAMTRDELEAISQVPAWMNSKALTVLA
jgi:hypothetical protein